MKYRIQYADIVVREDIPKLSAAARKQVRLAIEKKLSVHPEVFGKPLRYSLQGARSLRVGDYRVIFRIRKNTVEIYAIQHHSRVYQDIRKK